MSDYTEWQREHFASLGADIVKRLRNSADRVERELARPLGKYSTHSTRAGDVVHEIHTALANLPLNNLIAVAAEADKGPSPAEVWDECLTALDPYIVYGGDGMLKNPYKEDTE